MYLSIPLGLILFFKFFSPSSELVYIKQMPSLLEARIIRSAGNISPSLIYTKSPTSISSDLNSVNFPSLSV